MRAVDRIAAGALVTVLTWLLFMGLSPQDARLRSALDGTDAYVASQSALHRDVLSAHARLLNNYDPIDADILHMRVSLQRIADHRQTDAERRNGAILLDKFRFQEGLAERFKTGNALVQNSLAYFAAYGGAVAARTENTIARSAVDRLSSAMLHLSLNGSLAIQNDVDRAIDHLRQACRRATCGREVEGLLTHGLLLKRLLPELAVTIETLMRSGSEQQIGQLRSELLQRQEAAEAAARRFRIALYLTSLTLVYLLVRWGVQMRAHATALQRQLALEHAVSRLSTQLIAAPPDEVPNVVRTGIAHLARALDASEARFVLGRTGRACTWPMSVASLPDRWADWLSGISAPFGDDGHGVVYLSRASLPIKSPERRALESARLETCFCILPPRGGGNHNLLAFGFADSRSDWPVRQLAVLRTALDAISMALDHAHLAKERAQLTEQLDHARRMETVGAFASGIAHNFNNLLGAIAGHVEMAGEYTGGSASLQDHLEKIGMSAERGRQLVRGLLRYGRRHEGQRTPLDFDALVLESCGLAQAGLSGTHRIICHVRAPDTPVLADAAQLQQVILNLCNNAAQAMRDGGVIEVGTDRRPTESGSEPGQVVLTVTDSGCGIPPDILPRVFEPFFTTRPSGTGLGLSTAQDIVTQQGGTMTLASVMGAGTTVTVSFPPSEAIEFSFQGAGEILLYLADDNVERLAGEERLAALGYEPIGFVDPERCRAALKAAPHRFQAVFIAGDKLNHEARPLLLEARALCPSVPRLLAIRHYRGQDAASLADAGVTSLLQYPLDAREVAIALHRALVPPAM
jgi:signal transduction histidine kinase